MISLSDEILAALPELMRRHPLGPNAAQVAEALTLGPEPARAAMKALNDDGRAWLARYPGSKRRHLLPRDHFDGTTHRVCANCRVVFEPKGSKRACCTRSCSHKWSWSKPETRANLTAALGEAARRPEARARTAARNAVRWADPREREKLSAQNRQRWADPAQKARRSASIQAVNGSPENRAKAAETRRKLWADPEYRERATKALRKARKTPEARARQSELMRARWADPVLRQKYLAATRVNSRKAVEAVAGRKQSPDHLAKRVEATKRTRRERPHKQSPEHIAKRVEAIKRSRAERSPA